MKVTTTEHGISLKTETKSIIEVADTKHGVNIGVCEYGDDPVEGIFGFKVATLTLDEFEALIEMMDRYLKKLRK